MAMQKGAIYTCGKGSQLEAVMPVDGCTELVCCGEPMTLAEEKTADKSTEKHVPVIEKIDGGYKVTVGTTIHPMTDEHYIEWIELWIGAKLLRHYLKPGDEPIATFKVDEAGEPRAREHCNKHGLWKS